MDDVMLKKLIEESMQKAISKYFEDKYIFVATSRNEYLQAVHASDVLLAIWNVDNKLREWVKWNPENLSGDVINAYDEVRTLIYDTMNYHGVSLDMLE